MVTDKNIVEGLFAGNNSAYYSFNKVFRVYFKAYFQKHFRTQEDDISELYQKTLMELWDQIINGKFTKDDLTGDISSYLITIGRNKFYEESRRKEKYSRLKKGERVYNKRQSKTDDSDEEPEDKKAYPLQSKKKQEELHTSLNEYAYLPPDNTDPFSESEEDYQKRQLEKKAYIREQLRNMQEPCRSILIDTWLNMLSDKEILEVRAEDNDLQYTNTNALSTRRFRCYQKFRAEHKAWFDRQAIN